MNDDRRMKPSRAFTARGRYTFVMRRALGTPTNRGHPTLQRTGVAGQAQHRRTHATPRVAARAGRARYGCVRRASRVAYGSVTTRGALATPVALTADTAACTAASPP